MWILKSGELDIVERMNSTGQLQPYLILGKWGTGFLIQTTSNEFTWQIDTDYVQTYYSAGYYGEPDFTGVYDGTSLLAIKEFDSVYLFEKGQFVGNLPAQPWSPDSCGPEEN